MPGGNSNDAAIQQQQQQQKAVQSATGQINNAFAGFTPQFYQNYINANEAAGMPQLQQQFRNNNQQAVYGLANRGLLNSGAANTVHQGLTDSLNQGRMQLANNAIGGAQQLRQQIGQQKSNLIGQASLASDPGAIGGQAFQIASGFQSPSMSAPIGNLFQNFADTFLANRLNNAYSGFTNGQPGIAGGYGSMPFGGAGNSGLTYRG